MKKIILLLLVLLAMPLSSIAQVKNWVSLTGSFPDENFQKVIKVAAGTANVNGDLVDVNAITTINLSSTDGMKVRSTQGIQLCKALQTLTLKGQANKTTVYYQEIDVSGLPMLTKIDNGVTRYNLTTAPSSRQVALKDVPALNTGLTMVNDLHIIARNCPKLTYVNLSHYPRLVEFDCEGSEAITELYLLYSAIETLDISHLKSLKNKKPNSWSDNELGWGLLSTSDRPMDNYRQFSLYRCEKLKSLKIGDLGLNYLDLSYCNSLTDLDLSEMSELERFHAVLDNNNTSATAAAPEYSTTNKFSDNNHTHICKSKGTLQNLILPKSSKLAELTVQYGLLSHLDLSIAGTTLKWVDLSYNMFREFKMSDLQKAVRVDLGFNRIRHLDLPPTTCTYLSITDNALTNFPQIYNSGRTNLSCSSMYQYVRVGDVYRFKVFDNEGERDLVAQQDDTSKGYYYGLQGNDLKGRIHLGDPDVDEKDYYGVPTGRKEDPLYVYFENDFSDGIYFYSNKTKDATSCWMKIYLCRGSDEDVDPKEAIEWYLAGDFNNWKPTETDRFEYNKEDDHYYLSYDDGQIIERHFRVWGINPNAPVKAFNGLIPDASYVYTSKMPAEGEKFYTVDDAVVDYGAHADDKEIYDGIGAHVLFTKDIKHKMDTDLTRHYTTYIPDPEQPWAQSGFRNPSFEMKVDNLNSPDNYILLRGGDTTTVESIAVDNDDNSAPVEYFDLSGRRTDAKAPGLYIRRQGASTAKVLVH